MSFANAQKVAEGSADALIRELEALQGRVAQRLVLLASELETDSSGKILNNEANLVRLSLIMKEARASFVDEQFLEAIADYVESFDSITDEIEEGFGDLGDVDPEQLRAIDRTYKAQMAEHLSNPSTYSSETWMEASTSILVGIATGSPLRSTLEGVYSVVTSGGIVRSVEADVRTAPIVLQRAQTQAAAEAVGAEFFRYQGREIKTTRKFCAEREGRVWHRAEIEQWGRDGAAGVDLDGDGLPGWAGMVEGTNAQTIFTYLGGWYGSRASCRHVLIPLAERDVPEEDKQRMRAKGLL